jgi:hypothetical protein
MLIRTSVAVFAAGLASCAASPVDDLCRYTGNCDYEIRERLLSMPVWHFEWTRAQRTTGGLIRFEQRGYKLIGIIDAGWKCDNEVEFMEGGFQLDTCATGIQKFFQVDDTYQSFFGTYVYTIRPAPSHE